MNFFKELEEGLVPCSGTNKEYELEKREEREKYEKQIGYLTYLGQDSVESTGNVSWYNKIPSRHFPEEKNAKKSKDSEVNLKSKKLVDPLNGIRSYLEITSTSKNKERKKTTINENVLNIKPNKNPRKELHTISNEENNHHSLEKIKSSKKRKYDHTNNKNCKESDSKSEVNLKVLREKRLQREREEKLRAERHLAKLRGESLPETNPVVHTIQQKYSSQFNPHLAKQNYTKDSA